MGTTVDALGNTWETTWKECCGRLAAKIDPQLADDTRPLTYVQQDFYGNTTHTVRLKDYAAFTSCCGHDPLNGDTLNETTTKFDARHRPVAQTVWLVAQGAVDPNNVPIAPVPSADGMTTTWRYDENLTDAIGIDADYAAEFVRLGGGYFGSNANGSAVEVTNPAGEKTVSIMDGAGRTVLQIDGNKNSVLMAYDTVTGGLLEVSSSDALNHTVRQRADGAGRVCQCTRTLTKLVNPICYEVSGLALQRKFRIATGQRCGFDAKLA